MGNFEIAKATSPALSFDGTDDYVLLPSINAGSAFSIEHQAFDSLRENMRKQIELLEKVKLKRDLTKEEHKILLQLKNQLNNAELSIRKEMEQIEKELK